MVNVAQFLYSNQLKSDKKYWFNQFLDEHNFNQRIRKILNDRDY